MVCGRRDAVGGTRRQHHTRHEAGVGAGSRHRNTGWRQRCRQEGAGYKLSLLPLTWLFVHPYSGDVSACGAREGRVRGISWPPPPVGTLCRPGGLLTALVVPVGAWLLWRLGRAVSKSYNVPTRVTTTVYNTDIYLFTRMYSVSLFPSFCVNYPTSTHRLPDVQLPATRRGQ